MPVQSDDSQPKADALIMLNLSPLYLQLVQLRKCKVIQIFIVLCVFDKYFENNPL